MPLAYVAYAMLALAFHFNFVHAQEGSVSPSTLVAKQGAAIVTLDDIDAFSRTIPSDQRAAFFDDPKRLELLISSLLLKKQLAREARTAGLDHDPKTMAELALAENDVLSKARMRQFEADLKVPDFSLLAKEEYVGHKEKYLVPGELEVKQILISTESRDETAAQALAASVRAEAMKDPANFDELIEKYSEDSSKAKNHGLIQDAGSNRYMPEFAAAAKELVRIGEISPVVKTRYGFHILKLITRTPDRKPKFEDIKGQIIANLRSEYIQKAVLEHTDRLRNLPVEAMPEIVSSLRTRYGAIEASPVGSGADSQ